MLTYDGDLKEISIQYLVCIFFIALVTNNMQTGIKNIYTYI